MVNVSKTGKAGNCTCPCLGETNVPKCSTDMPSHETLYFAPMLLQTEISLSKNWKKKLISNMFFTASFFIFSFFSSPKVVPPAPLDPKRLWYPKLRISQAKSDAFHTQAWYNGYEYDHIALKPAAADQRLENSKYRSRSFNTFWEFTIKRLMYHWNGPCDMCLRACG